MTYVELLALSDKQQKRIAELEKERDEYHAMVVYIGAIMDESEGVAGYHLNGDVAKWDDLFTESLYKDAISARDLEQQKKAIRILYDAGKCDADSLEYFEALKKQAN